MFIDSHCHIDFYSDLEIEKIIERARKANVKVIINNGIDIKSNRKALELTKKYPEVKVALGIYPMNALKLKDEEINSEIEFIRRNKEKIIAIGEVGLDLKWTKDLGGQEMIFERFIDLAMELDKPIIVHSRDAEKQAIEILKKKKAKKVVMHCFSGNMNLVKKIIENGWSISIPTSVKYNELFWEIVKEIPIENLFCETDSPYLSPKKGEMNNEPKNIIAGYEKIAELKKITLKLFEQKIEENYKRLFLNCP
jgi:TatD DNase family protein